MTTKEIINHNITRGLLVFALLMAPATTFAYTEDLNALSKLIVGYFNQAIYVIIALAIFVFVWNVYRYFFKADPENKKDAALYVMYSVIGFFVIIAFWGLVNIVSNTLNLNTNAPSLNFFGSSINAGGGGSNPVSNSSYFNGNPTSNSSIGGGNPTSNSSVGSGNPTSNSSGVPNPPCGIAAPGVPCN